MPEQETIEMDPAVQYVVARGVIRASNQSEVWMDALRNDVNQFLFALSNASGCGYLEYALKLKSNVSASLSVLCEITSTTFNIYAKWSGGSSYRITECILADRHPIYWVIYGGNDGAVAVSMAIANTVVLPESVNAYTPPTDVVWNNTILNVMAKYCPFTFVIVPVLDSITNGDSYKGLVIPPGNTSNAIHWTADATTPFGKYISNGACQRLYTYNNVPSTNAHAWAGASMLLCGDTIYYPPLKSDQELVNPPATRHSDTAATVYLVPLWSPCTRCITTTSKLSIWGDYLDPDGVDVDVPHIGPIVNQNMGSDTFLQCYDFFMPVHALQEGE